MHVEPHFDEEIQSTVVYISKEWIVSVTPMIFNDRIVLTSLQEYPRSYTAGWCYQKGGAAMLAALMWDPGEEFEPKGFIKVACDSRVR